MSLASMNKNTHLKINCRNCIQDFLFLITTYDAHYCTTIITVHIITIISIIIKAAFLAAKHQVSVSRTLDCVFLISLGLFFPLCASLDGSQDDVSQIW